jgi:hypothetical protein
MGALGSNFISLTANPKIREMASSSARALTAGIFTPRRKREFELRIGWGRRRLVGRSL